jgi:hypothetical protein
MKLDEPSNDAPNGLEGSTLDGSHSTQINNSTPAENFKTQVPKPSSSTSESIDPMTEKKPLQKKTARAKVPFEKGFSQMDWLKLTRTDPDLAGIVDVCKIKFCRC